MKNTHTHIYIYSVWPMKLVRRALKEDNIIGIIIIMEKGNKQIINLLYMEKKGSGVWRLHVD